MPMFHSPTVPAEHSHSRAPRSTVSLRDGFTGQEDQSADFGVGYSDFGARQYSPTLSRWLVPDPLGEKYYDVSPYAYCTGNPVNLVDPEGREGIVVSGSPGNHDNKLHFLINGLDRAKHAKKETTNGEGVTWLIYNDIAKGFNQKDLNEYKAQAQKAGINVIIVSEVDDIIGYINNKSGGDSRNHDQISIFYYLGHSTPGDLDVGYAGSGQHFDPTDLNSDAFKSGALVDVVGGCRTAIDDKFLGITIEKSVV